MHAHTPTHPRPHKHAHTHCRRSEAAKGNDILTAVLEAAYIRQALVERAGQHAHAAASGSGGAGGCEPSSRGGGSGGSGRGGAQRDGGGASHQGGGTAAAGASGQPQADKSGQRAARRLQKALPLGRQELEAVRAEAHRRAVRDSKRFLQAVVGAGWKVGVDGCTCADGCLGGEGGREGGAHAG